MADRREGRPTREFVRDRASDRCEYCRLPEILSGAAFHVEHIVPSARGGQDVASNTAYACPRCNLHKALCTHGEDPRSGRHVRLFDPRRDSWEAHFRWSEDFRRIVGRTPVGRATATALQINSPCRQTLRALWRDRLADLFPFT